MAIILIGGGARSGKSRHALDLARQRGKRKMFLATAQALDPDMAARIARHRVDRGLDFATVEEPLEIAAAIRKADADVIVVDCLTLWLSNLMSGRRDVDAETEHLVQAALESRAAVFLVTNEVGCSIHPETKLGRDFRDRSGLMNQRVGAAAGEVYWMVFGQPLRVK
jgi:adenosylcobinamide kinase/adenosylcobinamide-phosphate guanylyltransferase